MKYYVDIFKLELVGVPIPPHTTQNLRKYFLFIKANTQTLH